MKKNLVSKIVLSVAMVMMAALTAGCGDDSEKAYLDEIKTKDYVELGEYKGIEVNHAREEITDEYLEAYITYILRRNPPVGVKEGDTVNIDYEGKRDGVAFDGGTASGANLTIGSGQFIPGFEDKLVGVKVGETVDIDLTFPEDYHSEEMAGAEVVFTVTVNSIMAAEPQELTEEYVKSLGLECQTVEEYRQYIYDMLYEEETAAYEQQIENMAIAAIAENTEFKKDPPQAMINRYADTLTSNLTYQAQSYGTTLEQFMQMYYGMDTDTYQQEIQTQAVNTAKQYIILKAIADKEDLNVSEEELKSSLEEMAANAGYESVDEYKEAINAEGYKEYVMSEKVLNLLRENAVVSADAAGEETGAAAGEETDAGVSEDTADTE